MRNLGLAAVMVAVVPSALVVPMAPAIAREMSGYTVRSAIMRAGPDTSYPMVQRMRSGVGVTVHGCLRDWSWCDVSYRYDRGWVAARNLFVDYNGRRVSIRPAMGIGILSFMFGNYWDDNYRQRAFYADRMRWGQHYGTSYRPQWGIRWQGTPGWGQNAQYPQPPRYPPNGQPNRPWQNQSRPQQPQTNGQPPFGTGGQADRHGPQDPRPQQMQVPVRPMTQAPPIARPPVVRPQMVGPQAAAPQPAMQPTMQQRRMPDAAQRHQQSGQRPNAPAQNRGGGQAGGGGERGNGGGEGERQKKD